MSQIPITAELRFFRIPTQWSLSREGYLMPEVDQNPQRKLDPILDDTQDLRTEFLKLPHKASAALEFLNKKIGVWSVWNVKSYRGEAVRVGSSIPEMRLDGAFGYRYLRDGAVMPIALDELWDEQEYWRELLLNNLTPLRAKLAAVPRSYAPTSEKEAFAMSTEFANTLPMHLEWKTGPGQFPRAVIQPITGREFLIASAWLDIVRQERVQVCQRSDCGLPFTGRVQRYCSDSCAHLMAVRAFRERQRKTRRRIRSKRRPSKSLR